MKHSIEIALIPVFVTHRDWALPDNPVLPQGSETDKTISILQAMGSSDEISAMEESRPKFKLLLETLSTFSGAPMTSQIRQGESPTDVAAQLLSTLLERTGLNPNKRKSFLRFAGYVDDSRSEKSLLVFTVAIPRLATLSNQQLWSANCKVEPMEWTTMYLGLDPFKDEFSSSLLFPEFHRTKELASKVLALKASLVTISYWADAITNTNAATQLLPKYFTMNQLRDVYRCVLDLKDLDSANFARWARETNSTSLIEQVDDVKGVGREVEMELKFYLSEWQKRTGANRHDRGTTIALLMKQLHIGASPILKGSLFGLLPEVITRALAHASAEVAFEILKRGKKSIHWYRAADDNLVFLKERFGSRPSWVEPFSLVDQISEVVKNLG